MTSVPDHPVKAASTGRVRIFVLKEIEGRAFVLVLAPVPGDRLGVITMFSTREGLDGAYARRTLADTDRVK